MTREDNPTYRRMTEMTPSDELVWAIADLLDQVDWLETESALLKSHTRTLATQINNLKRKNTEASI